MAWRVGAGFCLCFVARGILVDEGRRVDESESRVDNSRRSRVQFRIGPSDAKSRFVRACQTRSKS